VKQSTLRLSKVRLKRIMHPCVATNASKFYGANRARVGWNPNRGILTQINNKVYTLVYPDDL